MTIINVVALYNDKTTIHRSMLVHYHNLLKHCHVVEMMINENIKKILTADWNRKDETFVAAKKDCKGRAPTLVRAHCGLLRWRLLWQSDDYIIQSKFEVQFTFAYWLRDTFEFFYFIFFILLFFFLPSCSLSGHLFFFHHPQQPLLWRTSPVYATHSTFSLQTSLVRLLFSGKLLFLFKLI